MSDHKSSSNSKKAGKVLHSAPGKTGRTKSSSLGDSRKAYSISERTSRKDVGTRNFHSGNVKDQ